MHVFVNRSMPEVSTGYLPDVSSYLPYLIAIGFAPAAMMLVLVIVTRLEGSLPRESVLRRRRLNG
jgi:hypothetical protein